MAFEQKDNTGSLFKNDSKETDKHPDYSGTVLVNGEALWINGWIKTAAKNGKKFMSLSFKPKVEKTATSGKSRADDMNDSVGF